MKMLYVSLSLTLGLFSLPLSAEPSAVSDHEFDEGIAAVVDNEVITFIDVEQQSAETVRLLRQNLQGEELDSKIKEAKRNVLDTLIDRVAIIHNFYRNGGSIPVAFVDARVKDDVAKFHGGDERAFEKLLADRGATLDEYKKEIVDNAIVNYMHRKNVTQKVQDLKPVNPAEVDKLTQLTEMTWIDSLRQQCYVKTFMN